MSSQQYLLSNLSNSSHSYTHYQNLQVHKSYDQKHYPKTYRNLLMAV